MRLNPGAIVRYGSVKSIELYRRCENLTLSDGEIHFMPLNADIGSILLFVPSRVREKAIALIGQINPGLTAQMAVQRKLFEFI